jgi:hypothetical protein
MISRSSQARIASLPPELAAVVDEGVVGEPGDQRVAVEGVAGVDVALDRAGRVLLMACPPQ